MTLQTIFPRVKTKELCIPSSEIPADAVFWKALVSLAIGALLGTLVGVPCTQALGFSKPLYTTVQSLVATAVLATMGLDRFTEIKMTFSHCHDDPSSL